MITPTSKDNDNGGHVLSIYTGSPCYLISGMWSCDRLPSWGSAGAMAAYAIWLCQGVVFNAEALWHRRVTNCSASRTGQPRWGKSENQTPQERRRELIVLGSEEAQPNGSERRRRTEWVAKTSALTARPQTCALPLISCVTLGKLCNHLCASVSSNVNGSSHSKEFVRWLWR